MEFFLKSLITFPVFIFFFLKLFWKIFRKRKKSVIWKEESRYLWVKRYSRYLLWIYGGELPVKNQDFWNESAGIVFVKAEDSVLPLLFIKINDFNKQSPFSLFFSSDYKNSLNFLLRHFYSLINPFGSDSDFEAISNNLKIPRTMFCFFPNFQKENIDFLIEIAQGCFVKIITVHKEILNNAQQLALTNKIEPEQVIKLNKKFISDKIKNRL